MIDTSIRKNINIRDKRVSVIGLGLSGTEAAKLANHLGAIVFASDASMDERVCAHSMELMHTHHIASETGIHSDKIYDADLWIISPGIPKDSEIVLKAAQKRIPIVGEIEFASWFSNDPIIAITGSNGKTTTSHMLYNMCQSKEVKGTMAGNMGIPFSERVLNNIKDPKENILYLLEISSFQLEFIQHFSPDILVYTNISPDHLDRHGSMEEYIKMKLNALINMKHKGQIVYNKDDAILEKVLSPLPHIKQPFSTKSKDVLYKIDNKNIIGPSNENLLNIDELSIPGEHNLQNFLAASTCSHLVGISQNQIVKSMKEFKGVEHRLEYVRTINETDYINDSKATNIDSVIVAINTYKQPIVLILGGFNKGANFRLLLPHIKSSHVRDIVSYGDAGGQINTALGDAVRSVQVTDLSSAVKKAQLMAAPGDIVLLSPGCASYDEFSNFEERGNHFKSIIKNLAAS